MNRNGDNPEFNPAPALSKDDFRRPNLAVVGDRRKDKIHLAAGRAIHAWEYVDHSLGRLFAALIGTAVPIDALRNYSKVTPFSGRQQMIVKKAEPFFTDQKNAEAHDVANEFDRIVREVCPKAAKRRHDIAHGLVIHKFVRNVGDRGFFLVPSYHSARHRKHDLTPQYSYTSKEIETFRRKFVRLGIEVSQLVHAIYDLRGVKSPPGSAAKP